MEGHTIKMITLFRPQRKSPYVASEFLSFSYFFPKGQREWRVIAHCRQVSVSPALSLQFRSDFSEREISTEADLRHWGCSLPPAPSHMLVFLVESYRVSTVMLRKFHRSLEIYPSELSIPRRVPQTS